MMEKHKRKSHLAPQLSPATQGLLRGEPAASPRESASVASATKTPTSSEIPAVSDEHRPLPTSTSEPPMSSRITDVNGAGAFPQETPAMYDNQAYGHPPRTSSSLSQSSSLQKALNHYDNFPNHPQESSGFNHTLPIRPAPPAGPLPQPPGSSYGKGTTPRSSATNGSAYQYGEEAHYR